MSVVRAIAVVVGALAATTFLWALLVLGPPALIGSRGLEAKDQVAAENDARSALISALGGLVLVTGLIFTARTYQSTREGQVTDRYTAAVNQLGHNQLAVRLGGVYALERIARDSPRDRATVTEILAALIRGAKRATGAVAPSAEVVAALEVLSRLPGATERRAIDLRDSNLAGLRMTTLKVAGADLTGAFIESAHLPGADMRWAKLDRVSGRQATLTNARLNGIEATRARFPGAYLDGADLQGAALHGVDLKAASLRGIDARGANLEAVDLEIAQLQAADDGTATRLTGTWLTNALLTNTDVSGVDLQGVLGVTTAQRAAARSDGSTRWPAELG